MRRDRPFLTFDSKNFGSSISPGSVGDDCRRAPRLVVLEGLVPNSDKISNFEFVFHLLLSFICFKISQRHQ